MGDDWLEEEGPGSPKNVTKVGRHQPLMYWLWKQQTIRIWPRQRWSWECLLHRLWPWLPWPRKGWGDQFASYPLAEHEGWKEVAQLSMFEEVDIQPRLVFHESLPLTLKQGSSGPWSDVILATATFYQDHASQIRKEGRPPKLSVMVGQAWTFFGLKRLGVEYAQCSLQYALPNASKSMHIHNASTHNAECTGCPNAKAGASQASQYDRCRPPATNLAVGTFPFFCTVIKSQHQCRIRPCRYYSWY